MLDFEFSDVEFVDCPICGPAPNTVWMNDGKPTCYVRCLECSTVYASPRASRASRHAWLDQTFKAGANAHANAADRRGALAIEAGLLQRLMPRGGALLDIGCDLGVFFEWFVDPAWQLFGVELSPSAAAYASRTYMAQVFAGTLQQARYSPAFFDIVTMIDLLYYLDDAQADLREAARILKPQGLLGIEIFGQAYQLWRSRGPLCWLLERRWTRLHTDSSYLFWPDPAALQRLLWQCGFEAVGWQVIPSPEQPNNHRKLLSRLHFGALSALAKLGFQALTFAPKYLCIARKKC